MATNTITIPASAVPAGLEIDDGGPLRCTHDKWISGQHVLEVFVPLREVWQPPAWIPKGCTLSRDNSTGHWYVSRERCGWRVEALALAYIHGEIFTPPPHTNCLQVT
jgi:hypothetical protein